MLHKNEFETLTGKITITEQDGSYLSPSVEIGLTDLTDFIEGLAEKRFINIGTHRESIELPGEYKITIERIE